MSGFSLIVAIGWRSSNSSNSSSSTAVASSEKIEKLTPASSTVAPSGCGRPRSTTYGMSAIDWRRAVLVPISLIELNDVSLRIGYPSDSHSFDELAHVERSQLQLRVLSHLRQLRVQVVDQEGEVAIAPVGGAVLLRRSGRRLPVGREQLDRQPVGAD